MKKEYKIIFKKVIRPMMYGMLNFIEFAVNVLPRNFVKSMLSGLFFVANIWMKRLKKICVRNFKLVYGDLMDEAGYLKIAKKCILSIGFSMLDMLYYVNRPQEFNKVFHMHHEQNLKDALSQGKGVVAVTGHLSNFPLMFQALVQRGYKVNVVIRKMRDENFSIFMKRLCAKWGINMIETSPPKEFLRQSLGALKRNEILFILLDEVVAADEGFKVRFLNTDVVRAKGPLLFFKRTLAPIVPIFIAQDEVKHFHVFVELPFDMKLNDFSLNNDVHVIEQLTHIIEKYVKKYPLQWGGWFNKKWA